MQFGRSNMQRDSTKSKVFSRKEQEKLISSAKARSLKYHTFVSLGIDSGKRIGELLSVKKSDINFDKGTVKFFLEKKRKEEKQEIHISPKTVNLLKDYTRDMKRHQRIFNMKRRAAQLMMKRIANQTDIQKNITPHSMRYMSAQNCRTLDEAKERLAHENIETTKHYKLNTD